MKNIKRLALTTLATTVLATGFAIGGNNAEAASTGLAMHEHEHEIYGGKLLKGRTYGPIRAIGEELDAKVEWNNKTKVATIIKGDDTITMKAGSKVVTVNGEKIQMDASVHLEKGVTYLPMRYVGEALGEEIRWEKNRQRAVIGSNWNDETVKEQIFIYVQPIFWRDAVEIVDNKISNSGDRYVDMTNADYLDYSYPNQTSMIIERIMVVGDANVTQLATLIKKNGKWSVSSIVEDSEMYRP
ncbi:copper amine oxidase N-terminal domain-containing protein [Ureibacillus aquaedulcis]|uniref:Copper amine oxidase N-terminal domain-containing protein n=1 Tax=Ureibacillus aquaedulcis TaxID=3058421 RepID=A0ABT8GPT4_9BACL|nr:copper amine oxidase N-terminal domain-containing protein [Ureibacillus sp. BA0131]MDN4493369.1 copper amine oxidase N-terminal domain-containing protein [Ureibacillus sp. BA0131]